MNHNFKLTLRRIQKDRIFSIVNLMGLTVGISSFLILFLHVSNEKSFDKHFKDHNNIYRVHSAPDAQDANEWARSLGIIREAVTTIPEIKEATQFSHAPVGTIKIGELTLQQEDIMSVDEDFMNMFSVQAVTGNLSEINKPNTAFITEDLANKYFKNENPVGKSMEIEALQYVSNLGSYEIRGVIKNNHPKSHFSYQILLSQKGGLQNRYASLPENKTQWVYNYIKLEKGVNPAIVTSKILAFYNDSGLKDTRGPKEYRFSLMPMDDIHLKSDYRFELKESSSKINISLFVVISLVILFVSLLNFINLTIAKLINRSHEMGLKKSIGATKVQLIAQVLAEVFVFCASSIFLSFILIEFCKPVINHLFDISFDIYYSEPVVYLSMIGVVFLCLVLTALFVLFFLFGKTSTVEILASKNNISGSFILKSLLIGQVCIVIILVAGTVLVNKQINFISKKSLGFDKENVVVLQLKDFSKDPEVFADDLRKQSQVASVGFTTQHFGYPTQSLRLEGLGIDGSAEFVFANYDYLKTMNIRLRENWINPASDTVRGMVINEHLYNRLMERHGSMEALEAFQQTQPLEPDQIRINFIGVAKDFNYNSVHEPIGDFAFWVDESRNRARFIHVRIHSGELKSTMNKIREVWDTNYPGQEFEYFFIDDKIALQYKAEVILSRILWLFSAIGILISIIGISALSLFISRQRTKEIGIRKVNGAKISEVMVMLNKDFVKWVATASIASTPVAYYTMQKWLENFAYKTSLSWWIFVLSGILALAIALLTVSWQSWKAATRNPVEALRYE